MRRIRSHVIGAGGTLGEVQGPRRAMQAELVGPGRRMLRVKPPWQRETLREEAEDRRVVIEAEATEAEIRGTFTLLVVRSRAVGCGSWLRYIPPDYA